MKKSVPQNISERSKIIAYLKSEYRINPEVDRFDSLFKKNLIDAHESLNPDSLINSRLRIAEYKPLHLLFIQYRNEYEYKDQKDEECFGISLIENTSSNKFYLDNISSKACYLTEDFCKTIWRENKIGGKEVEKNLTKDEIEAYNSIKSTRIFEESDFPRKRNNAIGNYFNDAYRFKLPSNQTVNDLYKFYDNGDDTALSFPYGLYKYFATQLKKWKHSQNNTAERIYLKDQINLLLLQNEDITANGQGKHYLWVYGYKDRMVVSSLNITGNATSGFTYFTDGYGVCFF
jgi:hypothetical protein